MSELSSGAATGGMTGGSYYDAHSEFQRRIVDGGAAAIRSVVGGIDLNSIGDSLTAVDYGAGSGSSAWSCGTGHG